MLKTEKFDIMLLDIHMPELSGLEVIKIIRKNSGQINQHTKALAVTANILKSDIDNYMKNGFDDYVLKPFKEMELYNKICSLLDIALNTTNDTGIKKNSGRTGKISQLFDTTMLENYSGNDPDFYNKMIDTFVVNAAKTKEEFIAELMAKEWGKAGETAHKVIPSFKYFGLSDVVKNLSKLENVALRKKEYDDVQAIIENLINTIDDVIVLANNARINTPEEKESDSN
jgi:CheY-like chemotaxis protein